MISLREVDPKWLSLQSFRILIHFMGFICSRNGQFTTFQGVRGFHSIIRPDRLSCYTISPAIVERPFALSRYIRVQQTLQ